MLFNSFEFLIFFPIVFSIYWLILKKSVRWQNILLLVASYFFYGWWSWKFLGLLALSTLLDYTYGFGVASTNRRKAKSFLILSVINNLGILSIFKYYNFFVTQCQTFLEQLGFHTTPILIQIALPVGISFYTFHGMSYVFDIYRGQQKPVRNLVDYTVFVSFFPLLVAGPIERANHLLPQIQQKRKFNYQQAVEGCRLMLWGFFKKIVIADNLANIVDPIFNNYQDYDGISLFFGAIAFSFQIYGDFSGYSDIALGTAKLMGFELLSNFKFPYFSRDIAEFWRRWHVSLSSWFRDYVYIPLGGSKNGKLKAVRNTFIIFLISGFWHGASWNFIAWGFIHACAFLPLLIFNRNRKYVDNVVAVDRAIPTTKELVQMIFTFFLVTFAWIFFRSKTVFDAFNFMKIAIFQLYNNPIQLFKFHQEWSILGLIIPFIFFDWWLRKNERKLNIPLNVQSFFVYAFFVTCILLSLFMNETKPNFIYFQF